MEQKWTNKVEIESAKWEYGLGGAIEDREGILLVGTDDDDDDHETEGTGDSCLLGRTTWLDCVIPPALGV